MGENANLHEPVNDGFSGRSRRLGHNIRVAFFRTERQCRRAIRNQVQPEQLYGRQWGVFGDERPEEDNKDLSDVAGEQVVDEFADVAVDYASLLDRVHNTDIVVIGQYHVGGFLGHVGAGDAHGHADIGTLDGRSVVNTITGHGDNLAIGLESIHDAHFMFGRDTGENVHLLDLVFQEVVAYAVQVSAGQNRMTGSQKANFLGNRPGGVGIVAGDHDRADASASRFFHGLFDFCAGWVNHPNQANKDQVLFQNVHRNGIGFGGLFNQPESQTQHAQGILGHGIVGIQDPLPDGLGHRLGFVIDRLI